MVKGLQTYALPLASFRLELLYFDFVALKPVGPSLTSGLPVPLGHPLDQDAVALCGGGGLRGRRQHQRLSGHPVAGRLVPLRRLVLGMLLCGVGSG